MRSAERQARRALRWSLDRYANLWLLLRLQLAFFVYFARSRILILNKPGLWGIAVGASVITLVVLVNLALSFLRSRRLAAILNLVFVGGYAALLMYRWRRGAPIDFALLANNLSDLLSPLGWRGLGEGGGVFGWGLVLLAISALLVIERRFGSLSTFHRFERPWRAAGVLALANAAFIATRVPNELLLFVRSTGHYALHPFDAALRHVDSPERYPLYQPATSPRPAAYAPAERPHVLLVLMESFSADFVEKRDRLGRDITPYFNSLLSQGAYHELFFANSIQTERGEVATLCSLVPSFRRKVMSTYFDDHFSCLPEVLESVGYETTFAQALPDLSFDNVGAFMTKNGFHHTISMDERFVSAHEQSYVWGWGLQDDMFFRKAIAYLDTLDASRPQFVTLVTTSNHTAFDAMPAYERRLFAEPATFEEQYLNSIHLADAHLRALFDALGARSSRSNTLVILLGDHGFPVGQHGVTSNEVSYYNELFRVPLLVIGAGVLPFRNASIAYSQLDIAPSLLEWLGISHGHAFAGVPIPFRATELPHEQHFIPLVQPYDGGYVMGVRYPFKYVKNLTTDEVRLFNLASDPLEEHDLAVEWGQREPVPQLVEDVTRIFLNQRLLDEDRFLPH